MKHIFRIILPAVLLLTILSGTALAQTKIATVDLRKVFDNYYKTKLAQSIIQDRRARYLKDDASDKDALQKATDQYQQLVAQANDQAVSDAERDRRKQAAAAQFKQLDQRRAAIDESEHMAQAAMNNQIQQMHDKIMAEIQAVVNDKAKAAGDSLVIDTSPRTIALGAAGGTELPSGVVYSDGGNDLTADVLKQLNAGAPIDATTPGSAPVASPVPSMLNTNSP